MAKRKFRFDEGGDVEEMANSSALSQEIADSMGAGPRNEEEAPKAAKAAKPKERIVSKKELEDSGLTLREFLNRERGLKARGESKDKEAKKPAERVQTLAPAKKEDAGQSRILTGIKKNAGQNKLMGSLGLKSGGSVSSASRRADGIATKGKTRGKMC